MIFCNKSIVKKNKFTCNNLIKSLVKKNILCENRFHTKKGDVSLKKYLVVLVCMMSMSSVIVYADDDCCGWLWWRRPSTSITVNGQNSHMRFWFGHDDRYYGRCHHHKKYKKHHKRWKHRYDCDDCWDDD